MDKKPGSRRSRGGGYASFWEGAQEAQWTGITVTCSRRGHRPQRWKLRRDRDGANAGQIWFNARPDGTIPEQLGQPADHQRLLFLCPICGHEVQWTLDSAHARFDTLEKSGLRSAEYPL